MRNPKLEPWLDAGISRIAKYGLSGINVSEIADEIKITRQVYIYFLGNLANCNLKTPNKKEVQLILDDFSNIFGEI